MSKLNNGASSHATIRKHYVVYHYNNGCYEKVNQCDYLSAAKSYVEGFKFFSGSDESLVINTEYLFDSDFQATQNKGIPGE